MREEKRWRQLIVLRVGGLRFDRDRTGAQFVDEPVEAERARFAVAGGFVGETASHELAHGEANERVGDAPTFAPVDQPAVRWRLPGQSRVIHGR